MKHAHDKKQALVLKKDKIMQKSKNVKYKSNSKYFLKN